MPHSRRRRRGAGTDSPGPHRRATPCIFICLQRHNTPVFRLLLLQNISEKRVLFLPFCFKHVLVSLQTQQGFALRQNPHSFSTNWGFKTHGIVISAGYFRYLLNNTLISSFSR
jgi:hypothetical protein